MSLQDRSSGWKFSNSLYIVVSFIIFLNWISIFYPGVKVKNRAWIISGIAYLIPVILLFMFSQSRQELEVTNKFLYDSIMTLFFVSWMASIVHAFLIRQTYLAKLSDLFDGGRTYQNTRQNPESNRNAGLLTQLQELKAEIEEKIKKSSFYDSGILSDIQPMMETYISKAKELAQTEQKISNMVANSNEKSISKRISDFETKKNQTKSANLLNEYQSMIDKLNQQQLSVNDLKDQHEMIKLQLENTLISMQQVKIDLAKMEGMATHDEQLEFFKTFERKSEDLSEYLKILNDK